MPQEEIPLILTPVQALIVLVLLFGVPILLLVPDGGRSLPTMILESLGLSFLWNKSTDDDAFNYDKRRSKRKKIVRSRAEQQSLTVSEGAWPSTLIRCLLTRFLHQLNQHDIIRVWSISREHTAF